MWLIFLIFSLIIFSSAYYLYRVLRRALDCFGAPVDAMWLRILMSIAALILGLVLADIGSMGFLLVVHFMAFSALIQLIGFLVRKCIKEEPKAWRICYRSGIVPLVVTVALVIYGYFNMYHVVSTSYTLRTDKQIPREGYRVAVLADIHYGVSLDQKALLAVCDRVSAEKPDLVILCGDIVDNNTSAQGLAEVFSALGTIESTYGTYYVYGNHDRPMDMVKSPFTEADLVSAIEGNGITILQDDVVSITEDLVLVGRDDPGFGGQGNRLSAQALIDRADAGDFILVANHQPADYENIGKAGADLIVSGHTHGGQIWPANLLDHLVHFNDANYGLTALGGEGSAIVTSGVAGWGWPIKTSAPSEYVIIQILPR